MRALAPVVLASLLLAGCFGGCPPRATSTWSEPGVYDALGAAGFAATAPPGAPLGEAAPDGARLLNVFHGDDRGRPERASHARWSHDGSLEVQAPVGAADDDVAALAEALARELGAPFGGAERAALLASRDACVFGDADGDGDPEPVGECFRTRAEATDAAALYARLSGNGTLEPSGVGAMHLVAGDWRLALALPVREARDGEATLRADALDRVEFGAGARDEGANLAAANATFERFGLAPPTFEGLSTGVLVC